MIEFFNMSHYRILSIFIIFLFCSNFVNALSVEDRKFNGKEYQLIKDWQNRTIKYDKRFNSLIRDVSNNFIFSEKYSVINLNIKYFYNLEFKNKPKLFLDNKEWKSFTYQILENGTSKKDYDHRISFSSSELERFKSSNKLDIIFENFEAELDLSILPLDKILIVETTKNKKNSTKKVNTIVSNKTNNNLKKKNDKLVSNSNEKISTIDQRKSKIINRISSNSLVIKAKFGHDEVGGDPSYDIFWVWMRKDKSKDYDSIASFFCPVLNEFDMGKVISIKETGTYTTLGRAYCK